MKKGNIIALLLFLAAVAAVFTLKTPQTRAIQTSVMNFLSPFIRGSALAEEQFKSATNTPSDPAQLQREYNNLRQEAEGLRIIAQKYNQVLQENNKFRAMLNYRQQSEYKLTAARVLRRSASNWWSTLVIDKGALDGLVTDSPVITDIGLVGKTGKIAAHTAEVILLTDEECRVAARIEGTQFKGILSGERGDFESRPNLYLRFLDPTLTVTPGTNVYSTGDGGVFPPQLLLGKVKSFQAKDVSGEAIVDSAVNFNLLEDVFVVHVDSMPSSVPSAIPVAE
ncbi:rod shape-determining protein MreC [Phragmitibacter flavus]|uniref:Cell shape-determining protein MreC n=1 Tax=Phragmitibacter flavus TaxID=2576071 RepID=A0A5R8KI34_9BACT|nr:rod shape-determining protein MreC [Phragmitibacter flavus]TLD71900.1 rod shape-determining protein MreC [Phragmitibacter flavus]